MHFIRETMRNILSRKQILEAVALTTAVLFLGGCGGVTEERLASREKGIALLENGDYESAVREFEALVKNAKKVTDFELDVLKYRAEAEFCLGDYEAAAYTYNILNQVDKERAEYQYFGAMALAKAGDIEGAKEKVELGRALDEKADGYVEAVMALADAYVLAGNRNEADTLHKELLESGYGTTTVCCRLMLSAMELEDYEAALEYVKRGKTMTDDRMLRELEFNEAVCYEYLGQYERALSLFREYTEKYGSDERAEHEIAFLVTR